MNAVQVVYVGAPEDQIVLDVELGAGETLEQIVRRSGLAERCPTISPETMRVGVFGRLCAWNTVAQPGDRIEIYRPLLADPKAARRQRAATKAKAGARRG